MITYTNRPLPRRVAVGGPLSAQMETIPATLYYNLIRFMPFEILLELYLFCKPFLKQPPQEQTFSRSVGWSEFRCFPGLLLGKDK